MSSDNPTVSDSTTEPEKPPCPFCGSSYIHLCEDYGSPPHWYFVRCRNCKAEGPVVETAEAAWAMWERRETGRGGGET